MEKIDALTITARFWFMAGMTFNISMLTWPGILIAQARLHALSPNANQTW